MPRILILLFSGLFLLGEQAAAHLRLRVIGDVQVGDAEDVEFLSRSLFPELMVPSSDTLQTVNLFMGDQSAHDMAMLAPVHDMMQCLPDAYYTILGNHDRDLTRPRTPKDSTYRAVFGAPDYSMDLGDVHFMVLNDVYALGPRNYEGRLSDDQLSWLAADLQGVKGDPTYVLVVHIPAFQLKNADSLWQVFEARGIRRLLVLSAHLHHVERQVTVRPSGLVIHELSVGATCGHFWRGERDYDGVPMALMQCGTPRGYFVFDFPSASEQRRASEPSSYSFHYKGVGLDPSRQMTLYVPGLDTLDLHVDTLALRQRGEVYATVYGACDSTLVRCRLDDGSWLVGEQVPLMDSNVARVQQFNHNDVYPTRYSQADPIRRTPSRQVWRFRFDPASMLGVHTLHVEAADAYGFHASGTKVFWMQ